MSNVQKLPYDHTNPESIEAYAKLLLNKSLRDVLGHDIQNNYGGKGKLGQALEDLYFHYKPNSISEPDFPEAGVELKSAPLKTTQNGFSPKERLVFNIIDYMTEHELSFEKSSFWTKNNHMLLMMFLHQKDEEDLDYIFKIIRLWKFPENDLKIIKDDWHKIVSIIKEGRAHELSEGDTLYLGACTKGASSETVREQPFNEDIKAKQRAFSLKPKYLRFIIKDSLSDKDSEAAVKNINAYKDGETFEDYVTKKFERFYGYTYKQIIHELDLKPSSSKSRFYDISKAILGVTKKNIEEFEKAELLLKTVRLENTGTLKESMSFAQIKFKDIIEEEWEDSYWYETITKRFFFVVYQKNQAGELVLKKVMFWAMPSNDIQVAKEFWEDTRSKIIVENFDDFIKISDNKICHVRPKGVNAKDLMETASGKMEKKKSYWLNSKYIKSIIISS